jgi:2'-hydroxyisoflavone reductase
VRILVIGGSSFLGRHIVERALQREHNVTVFNRGQTNPDLFPEAEHILGDRDIDLSGLHDAEWDATVDVCGYVPRQVETLLEELGERSGLYTFISTVSVYAPPAQRGFNEDADLRPASYADRLSWSLYGELKVGCELTARELAGDRLLIVRPGYIVGPHDPTHRFTYWVERCAEGGPMLGPRAAQPIQVIDVRDLAAFVVGLLERRVVNVFHAVAPYPALSFADFLGHIADGAGAAALDVHWSEAHGRLPLSDADDGWSLMTADPSRATAEGLTWRPLIETARDTLAWVTHSRRNGGYEQREGIGMSPEEEQEILGSLS